MARPFFKENILNEKIERLKFVERELTKDIPEVNFELKKEYSKNEIDSLKKLNFQLSNYTGKDFSEYDTSREMQNSNDIDTNRLPFKSVEEMIDENMPYNNELKENSNPIYDDLIR